MEKSVEMEGGRDRGRKGSLEIERTRDRRGSSKF